MSRTADADESAELRRPARASDAERANAASELSDACAAGRLTLSEFSDRVATVYAASTTAELARLLADVSIPAPVPALAPAAAPQRRSWSVSLAGDTRRRGRWALPRRWVCLSLAGDTELDLTSATLTGAVTNITVVGLISDVIVLVPPGVDVETSGFAIVGDREVDLDRGHPAGARPPLVKLRMVAAIGDLTVHRAPAHR